MRASGTYNYSQPATLFTLSDIGLSVHRYANRLDVFTQALDGGKALDDVALEVLDADGRVVGQGKTEKGGHAQLPLPKKAQVLLAKQGEQTSLLRLDSAALDLAEFDIGGQPSNPLQFCVRPARPVPPRRNQCCSMRCCATRTAMRSSRNRWSVEVRRPDEQVSRKLCGTPTLPASININCNWPAKHRPGAGSWCSTWAMANRNCMNSSSKTSCPSAWRSNSRAATRR